MDSVYDRTALEDFEKIKSDRFDLSDEELSTLDERLSKAFGHIKIPEGWNLIGVDEVEGEGKLTILYRLK